MKPKLFCIIILFTGFFAKAQDASTTAARYNKIKNQTVLRLLPLSNIIIPGKWTQTSYNPTTRQYFFDNGDSTIIAVAKSGVGSYALHSTGQTDSAFVTSCYHRDSQFWAQKGIMVKALVDDAGLGYMVWQATGDAEHINYVFVYGIKNSIFYNFLVTSTRWNNAKKEQFITNLFIAN